MLAQINIELEANGLSTNMGSLFHGYLMESIDSAYAEYFHYNTTNPFTSCIFKDIKTNKFFWRITTYNQKAYDMLMTYFSNNIPETIYLKNKDLEINVKSFSIQKKSYDDLFYQHSGIKENTITIGELKSNVIGRGSILNKEEIPNYERFLPKEEFINEDNRFSPSGVEWLYLVIGNEKKIRKCAELECRAKNGDRFGFCHFKFDIEYEDCNLVDLTIADDISYMELNRCLKEYEQKNYKRCAKIKRELGCVPITHRNSEEIKEVFTRWCVYTYSKLLSEQIFVPLEKCDKKSHIYAPFQTMAQYYRSLGYSGIIYSSTVCSSGKNIVLFDKNIAYPIDIIEEYDIL